MTIHNKFLTDEPTAVTIGNFDGVHIGHKELIDDIKRSGLETVLVTFSPHPLIKLSENEFELITTDSEKQVIVENLGIEHYVELSFTDRFASQQPEEFASLIFEDFNAKHVAVGVNYRFGYDRKGNVKFLSDAAKKYGANVNTIELKKDTNASVSSTAIRKLLHKGAIKEANKLLCYPFMIVGNVNEGKKLGRSIGFPTLNIIPQQHKLLPLSGVYLTRTTIDGKKYLSITNVGTNPTVGGSHKTVETYAIGFSDIAYGKEIMVQFFDFIRPEIKFANLDELKAQIESDKKFALLRSGENDLYE